MTPLMEIFVIFVTAYYAGTQIANLLLWFYDRGRR